MRLREFRDLKGEEWEHSNAKLWTNRVLAAAALGPLALPTALAAANVRLRDDGPKVLWQDRSGVRTPKIRTMYLGAEHDEPAVVDRGNDSRVMPGMGIVRAMGIDETPQFVQAAFLGKSNPNRPNTVGIMRTITDSDQKRMQAADPKLYDEWKETVFGGFRASVLSRSGILAHNQNVHGDAFWEQRMETELEHSKETCFDDDLKTVWDTAVMLGGKVGKRLGGAVTKLYAGDVEINLPNEDADQLWTPAQAVANPHYA